MTLAAAAAYAQATVSSAPRPAAESATRCWYCGAADLHASRPRGLREWALALLVAFSPIRCVACGRRYAILELTQSHAPSRRVDPRLRLVRALFLLALVTLTAATVYYVLRMVDRTRPRGAAPPAAAAAWG